MVPISSQQSPCMWHEGSHRQNVGSAWQNPVVELQQSLKPASQHEPGSDTVGTGAAGQNNNL